jgi:acyl carrier protein
MHRQTGTLRPDRRDREKGRTPVTNEEILHGLAEIVNEVAGVETSEITPEKSFVDELDIDSLSMVEIAVQVEDRFGVKVPDDVLANLKTVGDAVDYVAKTT